MPNGKVESVTMLHVSPEAPDAIQLFSNVPRDIVKFIWASDVLSVPQSSATVPWNFMVTVLEKLVEPLGVIRVLLKLPTKVKFRGSEILFLTKSCPVVSPFQSCFPRKKFPVLAHQSFEPPPVLVMVLFI